MRTQQGVKAWTSTFCEKLTKRNAPTTANVTPKMFVNVKNTTELFPWISRETEEGLMG